MKQSRKEFIKRLFENASPIWKVQIEKEFPKLFKKDALQAGKWYKSDWGYKFCFNGEYDIDSDPRGYGFSKIGDFLIDNKTSKRGGWGKHNLTKATDREVKQALIKEAKRLGFKEGVVADLRNCGHGVSNAKIIEENYRYNGSWLSLDSYIIFKKGKWATIVEETITKKTSRKRIR